MSNVVTYPHTEEPEMSKVKEIFDRALNALVSASSLAKEVEQVKSDLEALTSQVNHYRNTIANQDDQITRLRQDRDAARTAQYQSEDDKRHMTTELENVKRDADSLSSANIRLNDRVSQLIKERDDAEFRLLELQESHSVLSEKLNAIKSHMEGLFAVSTVSPVPDSSTVIAPMLGVGSTSPVALSSSEEHKEVDYLDVPSPALEPGPPVNPPEPSPSTPMVFPEDI